MRKICWKEALLIMFLIRWTWHKEGGGRLDGEVAGNITNS